jgi:hypothetical protein
LATTLATVLVAEDTVPVREDKRASASGSAAGTGEAMAVRVRPKTLRMV